MALCRYMHAQQLVIYDEVGQSGNCWLARLLDNPSEAVMVKPTGGNPTQYGASLGYDEPTVQLLVRGTRDPRTGAALAQSLYDHMVSLHAVTLDPNGEAVRLIDCQSLQSAPAHIGTDETGRHMYSLNLALHVRNKTPNRE